MEHYDGPDLGWWLDDPFFDDSPNDTAVPSRPSLDGPDGTSVDNYISHSGRTLACLPASDIKPKKAKWILDMEIPAGITTVFAGKGGCGKSTYALSIIAGLSRGTLPGAYYGIPRNVLYAAVEDDWQTVVIPRLIAAGADLNRVFALEAIDRGIDSQFQLPLDAELVRNKIIELEAALVVLDPATSIGTGDWNKREDVRATLNSINNIGHDTGCAFIAICHFGKGGGHASDKISGSAAIRDTARSVFLFAEDSVVGCTIVSHDKSNYGVTVGDRCFEIEGFVVEAMVVDEQTGMPKLEQFPTSRLAGALRDCAVSVEEVINRPLDTENKSKVTKAADWLTDYLSENGDTPSEQVLRAGAAAGHSERTVHRARSVAGIVASGSARGRPSIWSLPRATAANSGAEASVAGVSRRSAEKEL